MNTDFVVDISDRATDNLLVLFNTEVGREYLRERMGVPQDGRRPALLLRVLVDLQRARGDQGGQATGSRARRRHRHGGHRRRRACTPRRSTRIVGARPSRHLRRGGRRRGPGGLPRRRRTADMLECTHEDRQRMFNLGYYTWVEQQGVSFEEFDGAARARLLGRDPPDRARVGRHDRRVQRRGGRVTMPARPVTPGRLPLSARAAAPRSRPSGPSPGPARPRRPATTSTTCSARRSDLAAMAAQTTRLRTTPSCATALASTATTWPARAAGATRATWSWSRELDDAVAEVDGGGFRDDADRALDSLDGDLGFDRAGASGSRTRRATSRARTRPATSWA